MSLTIRFLCFLSLFYLGIAQNLSCLTSGVTSSCSISGPLSVNVTAGSDDIVAISTPCNVHSAHAAWTFAEGLNITGAINLNESSITIAAENATVGSSGTFTTLWCDSNDGLLNATVTIQIIAPDVCAMDTMECPDGSWVARDTGLGCRFRPCACGGSSCFCTTNEIGATICVRAAQMGEHCHPSWGPYYDNATCVTDYSCVTPTDAGLGASGFCVPTYCADSTCLCSVNSTGGSICVRRARVGEACNPTLGPLQANSSCEDGFSCNKPDGALLGSSGYCLPPACGDSTCLCTINNGAAVCVRRARFGESCKPSLGPLQANSSCEVDQSCVVPSGAPPGASGVCHLSVCGDSSCLCSTNTPGELICVRRAREGETCNPTLGPFQANSTCEDGYSCVHPAGVFGASGVCTLDVVGTPESSSSSGIATSTGKEGTGIGSTGSSASIHHPSAILVLVAILGLFSFK